jgi:ankyrin repeat protein
MASASEELFAAIEADDAGLARDLVSRDPRLASARDAEGVTARMRARYRSDRSLIEVLRSAGGELDVFEAAAFGEVDRLRVLLTEPDAVRSFSPDGFTPLHLAAFFGATAAAELLLGAGADPDAPGRGWMTGTPLHSAASGRHSPIVGLLLGAGADPDRRQAGGWTPLHAAAHNGDAVTAALLLDAGADPTARNDEGTSVLEMAEGSGDEATLASVRSALGS